MPLEIIKYPNRILRKKATAITDFALTKELASTLNESLSLSDDGVAIAANQVGIDAHAFVISNTFPAPFRVFFNASYAEYRYENAAIFESDLVKMEGCLSFPGLRIPVRRHYAVKVTFDDIDGNRQTIIADEMFARIIQHEVDHLDGILFIDYLPKKQRALVVEKILSR